MVYPKFHHQLYKSTMISYTSFQSSMSSSWEKQNQIWSLWWRTVGQNNQKYRLKYWATRSSVHLFACIAHAFPCFTLLAFLARSAALTRSLTSLAPSFVGQWMIRWLFILCFFLFWPTVRGNKSLGNEKREQTDRCGAQSTSISGVPSVCSFGRSPSVLWWRWSGLLLFV